MHQSSEGMYGVTESDEKWQRLLEEQQAAIDQTKARIHQLDKFQADYEALESRLHTLPHQTTHDVMVPFGKLAFMPGQLIHTNEITVLLGDNWFVERSAMQAVEIVQRRIEGVRQQNEELRKQADLLAPRIDFTSQMQNLSKESSDVFEIQEDYDPEKEILWKEAHKKKVQSFHRKQQQARHAQQAEKQAEQGSQRDEKGERREKTHEEIWERLDELQRQETAGRELARMTAEDVEAPDVKTISWQDQVHPAACERTEHFKEEEDEEDSEEEEEGEDETQTASSTISFTHTPTLDSDTKSTEDTDPDIITSPADIYRVYMSKPKSILKSPTQSFSEKVTQEVDEAPVKPKTIVHIGEGAFAESVVERSAVEPKKEVYQEPAGRMSRFKAQRQSGKS